MTQFITKFILFLSIFSSSLSYSQSVTTEQRFQDLFVTAGYGTAFGAAMGAAVLSFQKQPEENLRYVAIGASIGFITGSLFGSYIVFSPVFQHKQALLEAPSTAIGSKFSVSPILSSNDFSFNGVVGGMNIARF